MIRKIREEDRSAYVEMARDFYASEAVCQSVPARHFADTFRELMRSEQYGACYILEYKNQIAGYALLAKTFSQEAGGATLWIDELYVKPDFRSCGLGHEFFSYLKKNLPEDVKRLRLEVEDDNRRAVSLYRKLGFGDLPYSQMVLDL